MQEYPVAIVDLRKLSDNYVALSKLTKKALPIIVLKANAYGHGVLACVNALLPFNPYVAVARTSEAECIVKEFPRLRIIVLGGFTSEHELDFLLLHGLDIVVHSQYQIELLKKINVLVLNKVWIKVNTGMHRLGFSTDTFKSALDELKSLPIKKISLISHLACSDDSLSNNNIEQITKFEHFVSEGDIAETTLFASGFLNLMDSPNEYDYIRFGLSLYGVYGKGFSPVMKVLSKVIAVYPVKRHSKIGYGSNYLVEKDTNIAVVGYGYGDGYPRGTKKGIVSILGNFYPIVGSINMDTLTVDVGHNGKIEPGAIVELFGGSIPCEDVAKRAGTIPYEVLTSVSNRVKRVYVK